MDEVEKVARILHQQDILAHHFAWDDLSYEDQAQFIANACEIIAALDAARAESADELIVYERGYGPGDGPSKVLDTETADERQAAIVAWLRGNHPFALSAAELADAIEARAHWKEGA